MYDKLQNVYCSDNFDDGCSGYYIMVTILYMGECNDGCILVALVMTMAMVAIAVAL